MLKKSTKQFTIAIIGRPNVGKSTLFNRIISSNKSITGDQSGITRDRVYGQTSWNGVSFSVIDTGGIISEDGSENYFLSDIKKQASLAMNEADAIIFLTSGKNGLTDQDKFVAKILYKTKVPIYLTVNFIDNIQRKNLIYDFYSLGLGDPYPISATHGL